MFIQPARVNSILYSTESPASTAGMRWSPIGSRIGRGSICVRSCASDLHGALHFAHALEPLLLVFGLLLQLRVARQRHHADEREDRDRHQHFDQREAARRAGTR